MRKLGLKDAFSLARIIKAAGIRKEIIEFADQIKEEQKEEKERQERERAEAISQDIREEQEEQDTESTLVEKVGFKFFLVVMEACCEEKIEKKVYALYADIKGVTPEEVSILGFAEIKADIAELMEVNDLKSFFSSLSALMSKQ